MDNLDDSENNAKISDSAYSNSCSNSQSRRSHSSKSTHSGSNSSGSSGYGGKPSTSGSSNNLGQQPKKEKETKKKKLPQTDTIVPDVVVEIEARPPDPAPDFVVPIEETCDEIPTPSPVHMQVEKGVENMDVSTSDHRNSENEEVPSCSAAVVNTAASLVPVYSSPVANLDGFSCVISMHDGVVMYATAALTSALGFPKDIWIGRSFIDFVHAKDRNTFASQITSGLAVPKIVHGTQDKVLVSPESEANPVSTMVCRIRRYRGLVTGFGVKEKPVAFMPFLLKLTFKNISDEDGNVIYLVIQATPLYSAFKSPYELVTEVVPFIIRHTADGLIEYVDPEAVPYLGFLPQDLTKKDALQFYHSDDLSYLCQVYETIVKEGGLPRSKPYRMMTQNGDYLRLETEWTSFINPWSKKLEFVTGKHHIIQGPGNPDVFLPPESDKVPKVSEEEKNQAQILRNNIMRIMNEVLTKPAEAAKQLMSKRCQDLASFMESLLEEPPKTDEELRLDIQDPDHSYYERDSVMLGGISPHHDYNDSKSSTETPLSYTQLNYNETLQRFFDSHQPYSQEDLNTVAGVGIKEPRLEALKSCFSPMAQNSVESLEFSSSSNSNILTSGSGSPIGAIADFPPVRLTETLLNKSSVGQAGRRSAQRLPNHCQHTQMRLPQQPPYRPHMHRPVQLQYKSLLKHNAEMEKELLKNYRESRSSTKGEREKATHETRKKKKEHLARCNASFQPTSAGTAPPPENQQPHGVKRTSKHIEAETSTNKHHCPIRQPRRRPRTTSAAPAHPSATVTTTLAATHWPTTPANNMNTFFVGVGIPQQMSIMSPVPAMPGMFPMYYAPASGTPNMPSSSNMQPRGSHNNGMVQYPAPAMPYMMYGQPMYGSPLMYSTINPMNPQASYPMHQSMMAQPMQYSDTMHPLGLTRSNYEEACKPRLSLRPGKFGSIWCDKKRAQSGLTSSKIDLGSGDSSSSTKGLPRESGAHCSQSGNEKSAIDSSDMKSSPNSYSPKSTEAVPNTPPLQKLQPRCIKSNRLVNSDDPIDKTDGESSYSSFYSSFFKTESGSNPEDSDAKKMDVTKDKRTKSPTSQNYYEPYHKKVAKRVKDPPWMEQVCVTSELVYKYQVLTKSMEEVLIADKQKMATFEQPTLVNDQLGQLYLDLQLEGVAARLTLEEGITSSSSSGEETSGETKTPRKKREYSKLVMIYEEDAPLPPPTEAEEVESVPLVIASTSSDF